MKVILCILILSTSVIAHSFAQDHDKTKISEIYLSMGRGTQNIDDPVGRTFTITMKRDGSAMYVGVANVGLIGTFEGKITADEFDKLATLLIAKKYYDISDQLPQRIKDDYPNSVRITGYESPVVVTGVMYDGKPKFIRRETIVTTDRSRTIPKEIFAIEEAITEAAKKIKWAKVK